MNFAVFNWAWAIKLSDKFIIFYLCQSLDVLKQKMASTQKASLFPQTFLTLLSVQLRFAGTDMST